MWIKSLTRSALLLCLLSLSVQAAYGCECLVKGSPRKELKKAKAVFVGEVVEAGVGGKSSSYKFRVERYWKGERDELIVVSGAYGTCSVPFAIGQRWLVYAYDDERGGLMCDICTRTTPLADADSDLKALGKSKPVKRPKAE